MSLCVWDLENIKGSKENPEYKCLKCGLWCCGRSHKEYINGNLIITPSPSLRFCKKEG